MPTTVHPYKSEPSPSLYSILHSILYSTVYHPLVRKIHKQNKKGNITKSMHTTSALYTIYLGKLLLGNVRQSQGYIGL